MGELPPLPGRWTGLQDMGGWALWRTPGSSGVRGQPGCAQTALLPHRCWTAHLRLVLPVTSCGSCSALLQERLKWGKGQGANVEIPILTGVGLQAVKDRALGQALVPAYSKLRFCVSICVKMLGVASHNLETPTH